ncbi:MAG: dihydrodiol dehydrogenase [Jatrophihabitantaceae bacterium]
MTAVADEGEELGEALVVSNEFAAVVVRKVSTRNGERLEIRSLGQDRAIRLDALALEALTWSTALEVGKGLETPFGPDPSAIHPRSNSDEDCR